MERVVLVVFLACFGLQYAIETALLLVNLRHVRRSGGVPAALAGRLDEATAERSRAYTLANGRFALAQGAFGAVLTLAVLLSGVLPWLDGRLAARGFGGAHRFVLFLTVLAACSALVSLPFSIWHTFVLEERFGFNRTTPRTWTVDRLKALGVETALGVPLLYATYAFMRFAGARWWIWLFIFLAAVQLFMLWLYPTFIAPLFNRFAPLPDGPLRDRLVGLAHDAGFANRGLYVMDASRRSGHSNAYFTGIFRPRIVLFDTLVDEMAVDEAASVLVHEIGHYRAHHVHRRLALSLASLLLALLVLSWLVVAAAPRRLRLRRADAPRRRRDLLARRRRLRVLAPAARVPLLAAARVRGRPLLGSARPGAGGAEARARAAQSPEPLEPPPAPLVQRLALQPPDARRAARGDRPRGARRGGLTLPKNSLSLTGGEGGVRGLPSALEQHDPFDVVCLRKHVHRLDRRDAEPRLDAGADVARERRRIAGDVDGARRPELAERRADPLRPLARGIEQHGAEPARCGAPLAGERERELQRVPGEEPDVPRRGEVLTREVERGALRLDRRDGARSRGE